MVLLAELFALGAHLLVVVHGEEQVQVGSHARHQHAGPHQRSQQDEVDGIARQRKLADASAGAVSKNQSVEAFLH